MKLQRFESYEQKLKRKIKIYDKACKALVELGDYIHAQALTIGGVIVVSHAIPLIPILRQEQALDMEQLKNLEKERASLPNNRKVRTSGGKVHGRTLRRRGK